MKLDVVIEGWPLKAPFRISGHTFEVLQVVTVRLSCEGRVGSGEAVGVYYRDDTAPKIFDQIERIRGDLEAGVTRECLQTMLPPSGARNAVDCALWDLEAKLSGSSAWKLAGLGAVRPLMTTFGCGADTPEAMANVARGYTGAQAIKLKLTGDPIDADRVRAVREARPDVWMGIDANQGFSMPFLQKLMPVLIEERISLIEQPLPTEDDAELQGFQSPIPIAADESVQGLTDIPALVGRFDAVNIKLDKCGGLTEALAMARRAADLGLELMVGNMIGTSLAMAPALVVGQWCKFVDLDGPIFLKSDRSNTVQYNQGWVTSPPAVWGSP